MDIVERAKDLAHRAHAGQVDKAGRPYIEHVARVAAAVADDRVAEAVDRRLKHYYACMQALLKRKGGPGRRVR